MNFKNIYEINKLYSKIIETFVKSRNVNIPKYKYFCKNDRNILPEYLLELLTHKK